ncbi:PepSY domain-containing protein [Streptococcus pacificus]|uniref:PepSY domain-containing protein n=1 Tax=Streptococcus pacificus TaxID=2740577 RepID=A0ABS0ZI19_9STRE|nr:PepSY domain-containing protein [Streptococcus pacificus]MBJ8325634.1 PepSY domain-containing protein [Streptococcus pacificus]
MKENSKKWLLAGVVAILVIVIGGFAIGNGSSENNSPDKNSPTEGTAKKTFDKIKEDSKDSIERQNEEDPKTAESNQSSLIDPITIDFDTAMETALKHAKTGFISKVKIKIEENLPYFEVEIVENDTISFYVIDANKGDILSILNASEIGYTINKPQISVDDIMTLIETQYKGALLNSISLNYDSPDQMFYEVALFLDGAGKELIVSADDASVISEKVGLNTNQLS